MRDEDVSGIRQLVARAARHDPDAWEALYRRAYPELFAYARRRLSSDQAADDAVSETMLRALDRMAGFAWEGAGFDAWLTGILRNVVLETYRTQGRPPPGAALAPPGAPGPLEQVIDRDDRARVREAFGRLDPQEQEVLELRVVQGLTAEGVGAVLGRRAGAVRMAQSRALHHLRTLFEERSDDATGRSEVALTAAVDPARYPVIAVTAEPGDGDPAPSGVEVLRAEVALG